MTFEVNNKRFIAGAVCPQCAELDKLTVHLNFDNQQVRECVECGYSDVMTEKGPKELKTRVNQPLIGEKPLLHEDEVSVVNIINPKLGKESNKH